MGDFESSTKEVLKEEAQQLHFKVGEAESDARESAVKVVVEPPDKSAITPAITPTIAPAVAGADAPNNAGSPPADGTNADSPVVSVATPFLLFYLLRGLRFFLAMAAVAGAIVGSCGLLALIHWPIADSIIHSGFWPIFIAGLIVPFVSSYNIGKGTPLGVLKVLDKNGEVLDANKALLRSLVFMVTWFVFPLHLIFIAAGSRRLLHDIVSGAFVVAPGENLKTSFYPAAPRWMAPLLVVAVVAMLCMQSNFTSYVQRLESLIVPIVLGQDSKLYLDYLKSKFDPEISSPGYFAQQDAETAKASLSKIEVLTNLHIKYHLRYNDDTARYLMHTARVAATAGEYATAEQYLDTFVSLPTIYQERGAMAYDLGPHVNDASGVKLYCADFYGQLGATKKAIQLAEQVKTRAEKMHAYVSYERSCALLYKLYLKHGQPKLAMEQRSDLIRSLKYHAVYLQQNGNSNWKQDMEPEVRLLEEIDQEHNY